MLVALPQALGAQEAWDLRRCIDHALENNLTVKSGEVSVQQSEVDLNTAKNSRLPDLAAGAERQKQRRQNGQCHCTFHGPIPPMCDGRDSANFSSIS